jgi:hypothetical protein
VSAGGRFVERQVFDEELGGVDPTEAIVPQVSHDTDSTVEGGG